MWTFLFFVAFSSILAFMGITLMAVVQPGASSASSSTPISSTNSTTTLNLELKQRSQVEKSTERTDMVYNVLL